MAVYQPGKAYSWKKKRWLLVIIGYLFLAGLGTIYLTCGPKDMNDDPGVFYEGLQYLLISVPQNNTSRIIKYDLQFSRVVETYNCPLYALHAYPLPDGRFLVLARVDTPKGRSTIQPYYFNTSTGVAPPVFAPDESMRCDFMPVNHGFVFAYCPKYLGALGGRPWAGDKLMFLNTDGKAQVLHGILGAFNIEGFSANGNLVPVAEYEDTHSILSILNVATGALEHYPQVVDPNYATISNDSKKIAFILNPMGNDQEVEVLQIATGRILQKHPISGRIIQFGYAPCGLLFATTYEAGARSISLYDANFYYQQFWAEVPLQ